MKFINSAKFKTKELKEIFQLHNELLCAIEYFTPGCGGILKGPYGFFEEQAIQKVLKDHRFITVSFEEIEK